MGAILLWCALSGAAADEVRPAAAAPAAAPAEVRAPALNLAGSAATSLNGRSLYWFDPTGAWRIEQVEAQADTLPWRVRQREPQQRLQNGALWIQFEAMVPGPQHWYLELGATAYDKVEFFYRDTRGAWVVQEAGTGTAVADWNVPGRLPTFALTQEDARPVRYWMRVQDDRADFSAPMALFREDALQDSREREQFFFGAYFGLAGLVALAALTLGLLYRDRGFLSFSLFVTLLTAGQLGRAGIGAQHIWREWAIWSGTVLALWPGAATAAGLWFVKVVTEPVRLSRALDLAVWALIAALLGAVAVDVVISNPVSSTLVLALTCLSLLAILSMVLWGWIDGQDPKLRLVALGFLPLLVMALFPLARGLALVPSSVLTRSGLFFGVALMLPVLFYALHLRLMERREGELRANALTRTDALTGLPHRQALLERLDTSLAHARGQRQHCALLGVRIANLDAITEEFGKDYADKALVVAGSHLRRAMVNFDMAARVGEREFAVLLEAPMTPQTVTSRAQQVVASGLRQVEALPSALTLKFHVTAAMLPVPQLDGEAALAYVLDGLDQMTQDARKLIKPLNF